MKEYLEITGTPEEAYTLQEEKEYVEIIKTEHTKYLMHMDDKEYIKRITESEFFTE